MSGIGGVGSVSAGSYNNDGINVDVILSKLATELSDLSKNTQSDPEQLLLDLKNTKSELEQVTTLPSGQNKSNFQYLEKLVHNIIVFVTEFYPGNCVIAGCDANIPFQAALQVMQHEIELWNINIETGSDLDSSMDTYKAMESDLVLIGSNPMIVAHSTSTSFSISDIKNAKTLSYLALMNFFTTALTSQSLTNSFASPMLDLLVNVASFAKEVYVPFANAINLLPSNGKLNWNELEKKYPSLFKFANQLYDWFESSEKSGILTAIEKVNPDLP
ncbi:MAG: hypothetical protein P0S95_03345 [Rhabdochlamydiaceae bacterium]|nr:hypothetical protein [Candidatus Amphrikana amoebophyrae]